MVNAHERALTSLNSVDPRLAPSSLPAFTLAMIEAEEDELGRLLTSAELRERADWARRYAETLRQIATRRATPRRRRVTRRPPARRALPRRASRRAPRRAVRLSAQVGAGSGADGPPPPSPRAVAGASGDLCQGGAPM